MINKIEEWVEKEKWWLLGVLVIFVYMALFNTTRARFICNDNICRVECLNSTGKNIVKTIEVNLDNIQNFEIRRSLIRVKRGSSLSRGRIYSYRWYIYAAEKNGKTYNFFKCYSYNEDAAQYAVDYLNEEIVKDNVNIDITYPTMIINGKWVDLHEKIY